MQGTSEFQERIGRIEGLVAQLDSCSDPALRNSAKELIEALMQLHGAGLERIVELLSQSDEPGAPQMARLAADDLIGSLLVLYGLHPESFETRVRRGLDKAGAILSRRGAHLDQIVIGEATVQARIVGAEVVGLEKVLREALLSTAPDAVEVSVAAAETSSKPSFVPLSHLKSASGDPALAAAIK